MRPRHPLEVRDATALRRLVENSTRVVVVVPHSTRSLAELTGFSHATIHGLFTGRTKRVTPELAQSLSEILGQEVDELFMPIVSSSPDGDNGSAEAPSVLASALCAGTSAPTPERMA